MDNCVYQLDANLSHWADPAWPLHPNAYTVWKLLAFSTSVSFVLLQKTSENFYVLLEHF